MFIEEIREERNLGEKFEEFGKDLGRLCDKAYNLLEDKDMTDEEREAFVDIVASIKGAKMGSYKLMEKYSKVPKSIRKQIDKKADEFVEGLGVVMMHKKPMEKEEK